MSDGRRGGVDGPLGPVAHVIAPSPYGGAESSLLALVQAITVPTAVAALLQGGSSDSFVERARRPGVRVVEIRCGRRRYLAEARQLAVEVERLGARLIHTHVYHADFVGYRAARRLGIPVVATVHGFTGGDWKNRLYEWLDRRLLARFDAVICVSQTVQQQVLAAGVAAHKVHLIPNGVQPPADPVGRREARALLKLPDSQTVVAWIGRLTREKGPDLLLDAVERLPEPRPVVAVVGEGPERRRMEARALALGMSDGVRFLGWLEQAARWLRAFDALVLTSRTEGTPMVLLEAMACGVPVVSFTVGGIPDILDATSGWPVTPGDIGGLAAALSDALRRPEEARRRAERAYGVVAERFGAARWAARVEAVYGSVAGTPERPRPSRAPPG
jgi:glycosyltransferase involved in cell wall biosynthesis